MNLKDKIYQASQWINSDNSKNSASANSNVSIDNDYYTSNTSDESIIHPSLRSFANIDDYAALSTSTSINNDLSGTSTYTNYYPNSNGISGSTTITAWPSNMNYSNGDTSKLKDLKTEIEDKLEECDKKIDEIFEQMKEDRSKTSLIGPVFQYYVGMRSSYEVVLDKIKKYLEDNKD